MLDATSKGTKLSVQQAATELGVNEQRVRALIAAGRLKATKGAEPGILGEVWRIDPTALDAVRYRKPGRPPKAAKG